MNIGDTIVVKLDHLSNGSAIAPGIVTRVWHVDPNAGRALVNVTAFPDLGTPKLLSSLVVHDSEDQAPKTVPIGWRKPL